MKKIHALATLLLMGLACYAQNESLNLKKYWQYREKFKKHFVWYSEANPKNISQRSFGGGIPFNHINYVWNYNGEEPTCERNYTWDMPSDPNTSMGSRKMADALANFDSYLGFLATEYRLLKNENADVTSILNELYYALYAADRLDKRSDAYLQQNYSLPDNADGYFIRDDGEYELADKFFAEYEYSNDGRDRYRCMFSGANRIYATSDPDYPESYSTQYDSANVNSKDQIIGLIMGLRFVQKFVDNVYVKPAPTDEGFFIIDKVKELADRIATSLTQLRLVKNTLLYQKSKNFVLFDTHADTVAKYGDMALPSWPLMKTCELITGNTYNKDVIIDYKWKLANPIPPNTPTLNNLVHFETDLGGIWNTLENINGYNVYNAIDPVATAGGFLVSPSGTVINELVFKGTKVWNTKNPNLFPIVGGFLLAGPSVGLSSFKAEKAEDLIQDAGDQIFKFYNINMLCALATASGTWSQSNILNKWAKIYDMHYFYDLAYSILNNTTPQIPQQEYLDLLNAAPYTGPYNFNHIDSIQILILNQDPIWNSNNMLLAKEIPSPPNRVDMRGEFSGRDYMILYNMYKLAFSNASTGNTTYSKKCTNKNTDFLTATNFNTTNGTLIANANVHGKFSDYVDKKIELEEQFNVNTIVPNALVMNISGQAATCETGTNLKVKTGGKIAIGFFNTTSNIKRKGLLRIRNNTTLEIESLGTLEINDKDEVVVESGGTLKLSANAILAVNNGKLTLKPGAILILTPGAQVRLMGKDALVDIQGTGYNLLIPSGTVPITFSRHTAAQGGKFQWAGNLSWATGSSNKLIIDGVTLACKGVVNFNSTNKLELQKSDACLDIAGTLNLGTNAKFTFTKGTATDGGYVRFSNPTLVTTPYGQSTPATITAAAGASMEFIGAGKTDKVVEVNQYWVLLPNNLSALKIQNGLVENTASVGFGELVVPCSLTVSNAQFITNNTINVNSRGIELYGQYHSIDNSEFRNFKDGAIFYGDYYNNPLKVTNCIFQGCRLGIMGYKDGGLNLVGNSFTNNYRGVEMSNAILASNVQSNIFKNTQYENTNGSAHGTLFYLLNEDETDSLLLMANGPNQSHCGIKYKGSSDLYLFNNTLKGLRAGVITENNKVNLQCNNFVNIQNAGIITIAGTLNMSAKTNNAGHNLISNIGFTLFRLYNVQESKILLNSGFNQFKVHNSNVEVNQDYISLSNVSQAFNVFTPMGTGRMASHSATTSNAIGTQSKLLTLQKMKLPMVMYGSAISTNPQVNVYTQLSMNRNKWDVLNSTPFYVAGSNLQNLSNLVTPSFPDYNPSLPFITIDNFSLSQAKSCGDTTAPCNTPGCAEAARVALACTNCDNVTTQEIGVAQTNVAANNAMAKMEDLSITNRYKKSLSIFTDVENTAPSLQGAEDQAVLDYVHEGTITALSEGLRKKQIIPSNTLDKAKIGTLENAYSNQIAAITSPIMEKKLEQITLMRNKAHVQHLQNKSALAMNTIDAAISKVQADASLIDALDLQSLLLEKCFYDISNQYNTGQLAKEYFSMALEACKASILASTGGKQIRLDETEYTFEPTIEMLQIPAEMPTVKEPPYRSYINEDQQGYFDETQLTKAGLITVMPNPAQNRITIQSKEDLGICTITFTDLSGRLLINKTITLNQNEATILNLDLKTGIYIYTISNSKQVLDKNKLVIINND